MKAGDSAIKQSCNFGMRIRTWYHTQDGDLLPSLHQTAIVVVQIVPSFTPTGFSLGRRVEMSVLIAIIGCWPSF